MTGPPANNGTATPAARHSLGLVFFPAYDWAISPTHPEREERLLYTQDQLREEGVFDIAGIGEERPAMASMPDVKRVHFCPPGFERVLERAHLASAGGAISAGRLVLEGRYDKAFALTRPPGHHAMRVIQGGRGFCAANIEAVMIERLRRDFGVRRVAVVDTDCHHGDGTQDVYWHDPDTLFISLHQDGRTLYPGTGFPDELGGPLARGATINIPLPPRTGDEGFLLAVESVVMPILESWKPDLIVNSAGQDNHFSDPITDMRLSARGYGRMVERINADIAVLEGGYAIQGALPYVNLAVILAMAGLNYDRVIEPLWREELAATPKRNLEAIERLTEAVLTLFERPDALPHGYERDHGWWRRERDIFYDTDGIRERQRESLRDCPDCPGLLALHTRADHGPWRLCLALPRGACRACRDAAHDRFAEAGRKGEPVTLQDKDQDSYEVHPQ
ncbi:MAG: histone deacetylase [Desulfovibrio sp.]|jgi:acetoin utilization deacetylase AcuC-like enzyme|nr:histone deacetylase [Desulfovibrio sp.]